MQVVNSLSLMGAFNTWKCTLTSKAWRAAILSIRVAACCIAIFGSWGQNLAKKWRRKAARLFLIHIAHNSAPYTSPLPLLVPTRNLPQKKIVQTDADIAAANALRKRFLSQPFVNGKVAERLKKVAFLGSKADGICFGASLCFLKRVLKMRCVSEQHLKAVAGRYIGGFSAKAAGMQMLYLKLGRVDWFPEASTEAKQGIADLMAEDPEQAIQRMPALEKLAAKATRYGRFAQLIGLKLKERPMRDFLRFDCDAAMHNRFNALPKGVYELGILTRSSAHSMAYLNLDFGSYLFDSNRGLMKCNTQDP
ncbi:MAG: hypothetical protein LLG04_14715, partial [Parachlamydia sp.]|nr:hypothetical protein [Parachlamydia sp.]